MGLLEIIAVVLLIAWVGGLSLNIAGGFIHLLLIAAVVIFALRFIRGTSRI
jgi:hypothetical protein